MPEENNITPNEYEEIVIPTTGVITDVKFGANGEPYEIGLGESTREAIEAMFDAVDYNFTQLNNELEGIQQTIDDNEETVSSALNDLEERKLDAANVPDVSDYFDGAEYDSLTTRINFKHGNSVKAYIDATNFLTDGMVDTVAVSNGNLVITFNTDAGKQPISIPLTDIFNPNLYYTKTEIDDTEKAIASALNDLDDRKLDVANVPDVSNYFDDAVFDSSTNRINFKNGNTVKKYIDTTDIFDSDDYYTKVEIDEADKTIASALNDLETNKADIVDVPLLYNTTGSATDGAMTQNAVTQALQSFNCGEY